jgi:aspartyl-tRNA(Asn)/glutamyl-tRNA(Gln) amidotransferase subunit A
MQNDLHYKSLVEAARLIKTHEISSLELTQACLDRTTRLEPELNCFITLAGELALQDAERVDAALKRGENVGPLAGIPLALKDLFETRGLLTTAGSTFYQDYRPEKDAFVVERLKSAGAVLLGKLNMHEIALGVTNANPHYGTCHNPWDTQRIPGGSSGGSAAALAAGMCFGSLGSDTGGSIRIPSSLCGTVGLKPTTGRVSLRGVIPLSYNLDHAGPMARRVEDVAWLLQILAGYDPEDPASQPAAVDDYLTHLRDGVIGWRIALADDAYIHQADPFTWQAVETAANTFIQSGARVEPVSLPELSLAAQANTLMTTSDAACIYREQLANQPEGFGMDVLRRLQSGMAYTSVDYSQARRTQAVLRRKFEHFFLDWDILLVPATPIPAPLIEGPDAVEQARLLTRFTSPFNLIGLPAISIPCGFTPAGLPIGLQLVARAWDEARLLQAAYAYESISNWHLLHPKR